MPKKFGINDKSAASRDRNNQRKERVAQEKAQAIENANWKETDKHEIKKAERIAQREAKELERLAREAEKSALRRAEENALSSSSAPKKVTHFELQRDLERTSSRNRMAHSSSQNFISPDEHASTLMSHSTCATNATIADDAQVIASGFDTVSDALSGLSAQPDRHPERRMKAAFLQYQSTHLPKLKRDIPGLRLSQYKQMLWDKWLKSPENPIVRAHLTSLVHQNPK